MRGPVLLSLLALTALLAVGVASAAPEQQTSDFGLAGPAVASSSLAQRIHGCVACHGPQGQGGGSGGYAPRIGGDPAGYIYDQLKNFQTGRRRYPLMTWMVQYLPDPYMHEIAAYFSQQTVPARPRSQQPAVSPATLAIGRKLVLQGDPTRHIPACTACHGAQLAGAEPDVPALLGDDAVYIGAQLSAFKQGVRGSKGPNWMHAMAAKLSGQEINAIAAWLATQPIPAGAKPMPAGSVKFPFQ